MQCARFFWLWMIKFCPFRRRNAIKSQITTHPIKAAGTAALCWVFSIVQRKDRLSGGTAPQGFPAGWRRQGCRGSRNEMLSPGKGITWPWHGQGTDSCHPQQDIIYFLYIPQFLPRGLRTFFIRHISVRFPIRIQKNTAFSIWVCLPLCGCAFFVY